MFFVALVELYILNLSLFSFYQWKVLFLVEKEYLAFFHHRGLPFELKSTLIDTCGTRNLVHISFCKLLPIFDSYNCENNPPTCHGFVLSSGYGGSSTGAWDAYSQYVNADSFPVVSPVSLLLKIYCSSSENIHLKIDYI